MESYAKIAKTPLNNGNGLGIEMSLLKINMQPRSIGSSPYIFCTENHNINTENTRILTQRDEWQKVDAKLVLHRFYNCICVND